MKKYEMHKLIKEYIESHYSKKFKIDIIQIDKLEDGTYTVIGINQFDIVSYFRFDIDGEVHVRFLPDNMGIGYYKLNNWK